MEQLMNSYTCKTGADFEQAVLLLLKGCKINAQATKKEDNGVDIIATYLYKDTSRKYYIQCKFWNHTVGLHPVQEVYTGAHYFGNDGTPVLITNNRVTLEARKYARKLGVEVIGDAELKELRQSRSEKRPVNPNSYGLHRLIMAYLSKDSEFAKEVLEEPLKEVRSTEQIEIALKDDFDSAIEYTKEAARLQQEAAYCTEKALTLQKEALIKNLKYG